MESKSKLVTCTAPVNIAVIKYWGKRDEKLILPINSSLSVTLNQDELRATTSVMLSPAFSEDKLWINGKEESVNSRTRRCLEEVRRLCHEQHADKMEDFKGHVHICSKNNFPTAAGLASSAAGYACLVFALSKVYDVKGDIARIARQGSGSACRSVFGGFVKWERGEKEDGDDSTAIQVAPVTHWPQLEVLVLVVCAEKKAVSSTSGMQTSVETSSLIQHRADDIVPLRMRQMEEAILNRDFKSFGELTMKDSNQFHAVCLDTYPPIFYLNNVSKMIIQLVTKYNELHNKIKVAYTFDAGPNAVLYALSPDIPAILDLIHHFFPPPHQDESSFVQGISSGRQPQSLSQVEREQLTFEPLPSALQYIIHTKVGDGPQLLDNSISLLKEDGLPLL